jgi:hypothetical protein
VAELSITLTALVNRQLLRICELVGSDFEMRHYIGRLFNKLKNVK